MKEIRSVLVEQCPACGQVAVERVHAFIGEEESGPGQRRRSFWWALGRCTQCGAPVYQHSTETGGKWVVWEQAEWDARIARIEAFARRRPDDLLS